jgi:hypothetical protein
MSKLMEYNKNPMFLKEGKVFIDGVEVLDCVNATIIFTPDVWTGKVIGEQTDSSRWKGGNFTGTMTRRRSTPWLAETVAKHLKDKSTPEFTIQGIMDDVNSDYYARNGSVKVTAVGCVLTGGLNLINLDSGGDTVDDSIAFNVKNVTTTR